MKCWICGEEAKTGEHFIKASDVRLYFPDFNQKKPVYVSRKNKLNVPIGSAKSDRLKSNALICQKCNNQLTQPYDKTWEKISQYIVDNWVRISRTSKFDLKKIFPGSSKMNGINFQLFFVKILCCALNEKPSIDTVDDFVDTPDNDPKNIQYTDECKSKLAKELSAYLLNKEMCPYLFLNFLKPPKNFKYMGITDLHADFDMSEGIVARAYLTYFNSNFVIRILYIHPRHYLLEYPSGWNPDKNYTRTKLIKIRKLVRNKVTFFTK